MQPQARRHAGFRSEAFTELSMLTWVPPVAAEVPVLAQGLPPDGPCIHGLTQGSLPFPLFLHKHPLLLLDLGSLPARRASK